MSFSDIRKYPAIFTLIPFIAGILLAHFLNFKIFTQYNSYYLILLVILFLTAVVIYIKLLPEFLNNKLFVFYAILILISGMVRFEQKLSGTSNEEFTPVLSDLKDREIILYGSVIEQPELGSDYLRILINSNSLVTDKGVYYSDIKILCRIYRERYSERVNKTIAYGDAVSIKGKLQELPHKRNPGEFDYGKYLKMHGIDAVFTSYGFDNINVTGYSNPDFYKRILYTRLKIIPLKLSIS